MIGPQLPKSLKESEHSDEVDNDSEPSQPRVYGPVIPGISQKSTDDQQEEDPEGCVIGPSIPKNFCVPQIPEIEKEEEDDDDEPCSYGPSIPQSFQIQAGPALPPQFDSDDDDIGPMPVSKGDEEREELERAYRLAAQQEAEAEEKNNQSKREEWMTSVPKSMGNFGLGPRTFKTGTAVERDSTWEDAPGAKKKRKTEEKSAKSAGIAASDARQAAIVAQKEAGPSLLEIHQKQREEKVAQGKYGANERRPFDREKDMEVRGLKPGGSKEVADRMKEFSSRFANSKEQRFL